MILDVGCGKHKRGDVGVDKYDYPGVDFIVDLDENPLPFPDNCFNMVVSHHLLEHLEHPEFAVKEMLRVCNGQVQIIVPHRYSIYAKHSTDRTRHKQYLNKRWFLQLADALGAEVYVRSTFKPLIYLGAVGLLMRPHELVVEMKK